MVWIALILALILILIACSGVTASKQIAKLYSPNCQGFAWHRYTHHAPPSEIRSFLQVIHDAFMLDFRSWLRISPQTKVMELYRTGAPGYCDSLELECMAMELEKKYGFNIDDHWSDDLSFGELFNLIHGQDQ